MGHDFLVVVFVNANLDEAVSFVEFLGIRIRYLHMQVYAINFGFGVSRCRIQDKFEAS